MSALRAVLLPDGQLGAEPGGPLEAFAGTRARPRVHGFQEGHGTRGGQLQGLAPLGYGESQGSFVVVTLPVTGVVVVVVSVVVVVVAAAAVVVVTVVEADQCDRVSFIYPFHPPAHIHEHFVFSSPTISLAYVSFALGELPCGGASHAGGQHEQGRAEVQTRAWQVWIIFLDTR